MPIIVTHMNSLSLEHNINGMGIVYLIDSRSVGAWSDSEVESKIDSNVPIGIVADRILNYFR